ncbi:hypothetical protein ACFY4C_17825 [Actinomadura viridis]|uniref:hypothetical protein n=1 Tax=Actinomadura viridis TaxID=58110 RepID=UPI0036BA1ADB
MMTRTESDLRAAMRERLGREDAPANPERLEQIRARIARRRRRRAAGTVLAGAAATGVAATVALVSLPAGPATTAQVLGGPGRTEPAATASPPTPERLIDPDGEDAPVRRVARGAGVWPEDGSVTLEVPYRGRELSVVVTCSGDAARKYPLVAAMGVEGRVNRETGRPAEGVIGCEPWPPPSSAVQGPGRSIVTGIPAGTRKVTLRIRLYVRGGVPKGTPVNWAVGVYEKE